MMRHGRTHGLRVSAGRQRHTVAALRSEVGRLRGALGVIASINGDSTTVVERMASEFAAAALKD